MEKRELAKGLKIRVCGVKKVCDICVKCRRSLSKNSEWKSVRALDIIHSNVCGSMQTVTPEGKRYILKFIDDFSRHTYVYLLKNKDEMFYKTLLRTYEE